MPNRFWDNCKTALFSGDTDSWPHLSLRCPKEKPQGDAFIRMVISNIDAGGICKALKVGHGGTSLNVSVPRAQDIEEKDKALDQSMPKFEVI